MRGFLKLPGLSDTGRVRFNEDIADVTSALLPAGATPASLAVKLFDTVTVRSEGLLHFIAVNNLTPAAVAEGAREAQRAFVSGEDWSLGIYESAEMVNRRDVRVVPVVWRNQARGRGQTAHRLG